MINKHTQTTLPVGKILLQQYIRRGKLTLKQKTLKRHLINSCNAATITSDLKPTAQTAAIPSKNGEGKK